MHPNVLFLEDVPNAEQLASLIGTLPSHADSPLEVAWALTSEPPDVLVVGTESRWAHDLLAALQPARRPAVVAVGEETAALRGLVDQWLPRSASRSEVENCFFTILAALGPARGS